MARDLDAKDAEAIGVERRSGIRSQATRMPVDCSAAITPPEVDFLNFASASPVSLVGYDALDVSRKCFLQEWCDVDPGPWTSDLVIWGRFQEALVVALVGCPVNELETFKSGLCDLIETVAWRQDDFEVVIAAQDKLYSVVKPYYVRQAPRKPPPLPPSARLQALEDEFGSLPIWLGLRDFTVRDELRPEHGRSIQRQMASMERSWQAEVGLWKPHVIEPDRPFFKECFFLILFSGHRREGDIATQICLLEAENPQGTHRTNLP